MIAFLFVLAIAGIITADRMIITIANTKDCSVEDDCVGANDGTGEDKKNFGLSGTVVLDAGHGGSDPGKIGINQAMEKDVNLQIVLRLKRYLEEAGVKVVLTRTGDEGLYDEDASNKKVQDMKRRIEIIDGADADLAVSIHQNSYPEESVHGAQVFYYETSTEGKRLAEYLQDALREVVDPENKRQVKANTSYYLLKKTVTPLVIAECGFLSNRKEADQLCCETYQEGLAKALYYGILEYLNHKNGLDKKSTLTSAKG